MRVTTTPSSYKKIFASVTTSKRNSIALAFLRVEIERAAANMRVNIYSSRPGIIIGKKGAGAESLKEQLTKICKIDSGDPSVNVYEVQKPDTDASLVAQSIKQQLQRRVSFRRAMKRP